MKIKNILFRILPIASIVVLLFAFGILFIPFSGVAFYHIPLRQATFGDWVSGFGAFFPHTYLNPLDHMTETFYNETAAIDVAPIGIVLYSFMLAAFLFLLTDGILQIITIFNKKAKGFESFFVFFGAIFTIIAGIIMLSMQLWMSLQYKSQQPVVCWSFYVGGTFVTALGGLTLWSAIDMLIQEKKAPLESKSNSYSYLKKK